MPPYTPPPSVQTEIRSEFARPDGRDRIQTSLSASDLSGAYGIRLDRYDYTNPDVSNTQATITLLIDERSQTEISAGLSLSDSNFVPEFSATTVLLDEENMRVRVYFDRGLITTDPRAVDALLQANTIGLELSSGDVDTRFQLAFNSDDVEVYEGWVAVPISRDQLLQVRSYFRIASAESGFYWSPQFFMAHTIPIGFSVARGDRYDAHVGVAPGFSFSTNRDGGTDLSPVLPVGTRIEYTPTEQMRIAAELGYSYGFTAKLSLRATF